jgi:ABC-2 type transport system permease protein
LEGKFKSNYAGRIPEQLANAPEIAFKERSVSTKMIVVSDGDVIANYVSKKGKIFPLGYDRITQQTYGNRNFILNCVDYLCDNNAVLELRGKEFRMRLLDPAKIENPLWIQWVNLLTPPLLIILFGLIFNYRRKKKFVL